MNMEFFAMPYLVMFHDTMAYGSHHFMTNFKFQCIIREHLLFDNSLDVTTPEGKKEFDKLILLTQEGYCRNLNPVRIGEKVAILLSAEEPTLSSVRLCFRVVRYDGVPITCGFQTVVCVSSETGSVVPAPDFIVNYGTRMMERLESPSFAERILKGRTKEIFDDAVISTAIAVANSEPGMSYPRFVAAEKSVETPALPDQDIEKFPKGIVFMFPGQGSYAPSVLRELYHADTESALLLQKADNITEYFLGESILKLITAEDMEQHDALMEQSPDLAQVGIYLGSVLAARYLIKRGVKPDCVVGHSAGELAALAIAGVYSDERGVEIICNRILALQFTKKDPAGMLAVFCDEARVRSVISGIGGTLRVPVINHAEQTVISGASADLQNLESKLESLGRCGLKVVIPFIQLCWSLQFHASSLF
jgi:acyl-CoA thioesterase FadM